MIKQNKRQSLSKGNETCSFYSMLSQHTNFYVMFCCCSKNCWNQTIFVSHTHLFFFPSHKLNHKDLSCMLVLSKCMCKDTERSSIISISYPLSRLLVEGRVKKMFLTVKNKLWADILTVNFVILRFVSPGSSRVIPYYKSFVVQGLECVYFLASRKANCL